MQRLGLPGLWGVDFVRRAYARWRVKVWDKRLARYRKEWNRVVVPGQPDFALHEDVNTDAFWEQLVTRAMRKRTKWRKRAGVRKLSGPSDRPAP